MLFRWILFFMIYLWFWLIYSSGWINIFLLFYYKRRKISISIDFINWGCKMIVMKITKIHVLIFRFFKILTFVYFFNYLIFKRIFFWRFLRKILAKYYFIILLFYLFLFLFLLLFIIPKKYIFCTPMTIANIYIIIWIWIFSTKRDTCHSFYFWYRTMIYIILILNICFQSYFIMSFFHFS